MEEVKAFHKLVLMLAAVTAVYTGAASACSRHFPTVRVRGDFTVVVKGTNGQPLQGFPVKIVLAGDLTQEVVAEQTTDQEGKSYFHGLMVSDYLISAEHAGVSGTVDELWTVNDDSGEKEITLTWPMAPISKIQSVQGHLLAERERFPLAGIDIWLAETVSGREVARASSDQQGAFTFENTSPGLYVLHIEAPRKCDRYMCKLEGRILVEVDRTAKDRELPKFGLVMTSCGLAAYNEDGSFVLFE